jgi:hypothetical protein
MPLPAIKVGRDLYRCGWQRFDDAALLFASTRTTGAIYLAGYGVECLLTSLILVSVTERRRQEVTHQFHGHRAHDLEWLRSLYLREGGAAIPASTMEYFALVNTWSTKLRYMPGNVDIADAEAFLLAASKVMHWADARI